MTGPPSRISQALNLRPGEGRTVAVLGSFLLLVTATTTILSAAKNALFLSVYPARFIPHAIIGAALFTAIAAIVFSGFLAGAARRDFASRLTWVLVAMHVGSWGAFVVDPRWSLGVYLLLSVVQVLLVTHAWDYVGDLLTGREAKRLAPLLGIPASLGALIGGGSMPLVVAFLPTEYLLLLAGLLVMAALPLLWLVPEPAEGSEPSQPAEEGGVRRFVAGSGRGLRGIASEPLLTLMAGLVVALAVTGTLIELQFKTALQAAMDREQMAAILGILSAIIGLGTLFTQVIASRWVFPRFGVSFAAKLHSGLLTVAAGGAALVGGVWILAALQAIDDIFQFSINKTVEQVSLLPFPGPVKSAVLVALGGVMRPLSKAGAGVLAIVLAAYAPVVAWLTVATAGLALFLAYRHRDIYMDSLVRALGRHSMDFSAPAEVPLVVDRGTLSVLDQGMADPDPTVVVFSMSLLGQLPPDAAVPRVVAQLGHPVAEVRASAAQILRELDLEGEDRPVPQVVEAFRVERSPGARAALAATLGEWGSAPPEHFLPLLDNGAEREVREAVLVALARSGWSEAPEWIRFRLASDAHEDDLKVAAGAVGKLGAVEFMDDVARLVEVPEVQASALAALAALGVPAVPILAGLLDRRDLPVPVRRKVVSALASIHRDEATEALIRLVDEPALGPAAITSLYRLRREERLAPVDPALARSLLRDEVAQGLRCTLIASVLRERNGGERMDFVAEELHEIALRAGHRVTRLLSLSHPPGKLEKIREALGAEDPRSRSNALELLEGLLSREEALVVLPFAEAWADHFPRDRVGPLVPERHAIEKRPLETLLQDGDWWIRSLALHGLERDDEVPIPGRGPDHKQEPMMIPLIQRVMILKGTELFRGFPGQELAGIAALTDEVYLDRDEILFTLGDEGDAFYMVVRGEIRIVLGGREVGVVGPREGFGEMALLDHEKRSATAVASEPTTLLRIHRDAFDHLVEQNPSVARGIYRMLTQRLRSTLTQLFAG